MIQFFVLLCWHAFCDVFAQWPRKHTRPLSMLAHTASHALMPLLLLGWQFGLAELVAHALIDYGKGRRMYGHGLDQTLHVACKVLWVALA